MDLRVGLGLSGAHSPPIERVGSPSLPLTQLALELPVRMARIGVSLFHTGWSVPGRDGIGVTPMSGEWLRDFAKDSGKHDDLL